MRNSPRTSARIRPVLLGIVVLILGLSANARESVPPDVPKSRVAKDGAGDWIALSPSLIAKENAGNWVAVWSTHDWKDGSGGDPDILVARSADAGATWTAPVPLNTNAAFDSGTDLRPQVATDKAGHWVAVWNSDDDLEGATSSNRKILVARSTDNGATWTAPAPLSTDPAIDSGVPGFAQLATDSAGNWLAVWHFYSSSGVFTGSDPDILVTRSIDNGATWTTPAPLNRGAATDTADDLQPRLTIDDAGHWVVVWYSSEDHCEDSLGRPAQCAAITMVARSTDHGVTWTAPEEKELSWSEALMKWWTIPTEARHR
jgi:hypothetical protein